MSKKSSWRGHFGKQHGKRAKAQLKSASQHLYHIRWSLPRQLKWQKSLLLICKILVLLVNTLAANEMYPLPITDNLTIPIQMILSRKQKLFSQFFTAFLKWSLNFTHFEKKMTLIAFVFPRLRTPKTWLGKYLTSLISEDPSTSNIVNVPKHCWNVHQCTFIIFIDHCQVNWVGKSLSYWHSKSWDCFLIHWLPLKSILFLIETI